MARLVITAISPHTSVCVGTTSSMVGQSEGEFDQEVEPGEYIVQFGTGHETKFLLIVPVEGKITHEKEIYETCPTYP